MQVFDLPEQKGHHSALAFSPDGRLLAAWSWGQAFVFDTASGTVRAVLGQKFSPENTYPRVGFTADGRSVLSYRANWPKFYMFDLDSGAESEHELNKFCTPLEIGPNGRLIYVSRKPRENEVEVVRWDPLTKETLPAFGRHAGYLSHIAVSRDEKWVAGSTGDVLRIWDMSGPKLPTRAVRVFRFGDYRFGAICDLALSADGAFVAYNGTRVGAGDVRKDVLWKIRDAKVNRSRDIAFHPAGPLLAYSAGTDEVAFYDVATRTELKRYGWGFGRVTATTFSPDGTRCAAAAENGKVVVWDVDA